MPFPHARIRLPDICRMPIVKLWKSTSGQIQDGGGYPNWKDWNRSNSNADRSFPFAIIGRPTSSKNARLSYELTNKFSRRGANNSVRSCFQSSVTERHQIWGWDRTTIGAPNAHFGFQIFWFVSKLECHKGDWGRKCRPNYGPFLPPRIGAGGQSVWVKFQIQFKTYR